MKKNLVLLRCGQNSLHEGWLDGAESRNWDLALAPFQDISFQKEVEWQLPVVSGQKWTGLYEVLMNWPEWRNYEYIWLPDDDLAADCTKLNVLFALAAAFNATLAAPSLSEDSYFSHYITMRNKSFFARTVTFVEIMMPCIRRDVLEKMLPVLGESKTGAGWGFDLVWPKLLDYKGIFVFDCVEVRHTRPVGAARSKEAHDEIVDEMKELLEKYEAPTIIKILDAYNLNGLVKYDTSQEFILDCIDGYRYLIKDRPYIFEQLLDNSK